MNDKIMNNKIINGNNIELLKQFPDNHFDSIVTDPPYGLGKEPNAEKLMKDWIEKGYHEISGSGFMGKEWDAFVPQPIFWKEIFRVLKPGGHILSFFGTRTYDWGVMAMRFAGFEVRDCIQWLYGCLSDDTEILTKSGYIQYHKFKKLPNFEQEEILIYDIETDIYKWEKPKRWNEYNIEQDTCYRIKSDSTDQIVSRNHRCVVEREGKLVFIQAELLSQMEYMPTLSNDLSFIQKVCSEVLQSSMQWTLSGRRLEEMGENRFGYIQFTTKQNKEREQGRKEPCVERGNNLSQKERVLFGSETEICEMPNGVYSNVEERWLCSGVSVSNGETIEQTIIENGVRTPHRPQPNEKRYNESNVICNEQGTQAIRVGRSYSTTLATITPIEYSGVIFCPTISTGCFVARRNGKVFITGNSGFPKSYNVAKGIEGKIVNGSSSWNDWKKLDGEKEQVNWGYSKGQAEQGYRDDYTEANKERVGKVNFQSEEAKLWDGWGSALKPAHEDIVLARKPLEKGLSIAENVLKWGTGAINIDGCRVGFKNEADYKESTQKNQHEDFGTKPLTNNNVYGDYSMIQPKNYEPSGRFPANLILSHSKYQVMNLAGNIDNRILAQIIRYYYGYTKVSDLRQRKGSYTKQIKCRDEVLQSGVQEIISKERFDTEQNTSDLFELPIQIHSIQEPLSNREKEILQSEVQGLSSETIERGESNDVWQTTYGGIKKENGGNENKERNDIAKGKASELERGQNESSRICEHNDFNTTDGLATNGEENATKSNIHNGTSDSNGNGIEKTIIGFGECTSHKRNKERQQSEQFSDRGQSESLENTQINGCGNGTIEEREPILEVLDFDIPTEWLRYFEYMGENLGCECVGLKKVKPSNGSGKASEKGGGFSKGMFGDGTSDNIGGGYADANGEETIEDWVCVDDCPIKILDEQSGKSKSIRSERGNIIDNNVYGKYNAQENTTDKGGASRFFYIAKASKSERNKGLEGFEAKQMAWSNQAKAELKRGNTEFADDTKMHNKVQSRVNFHPTVKPIKLMQYLVRLITPPNGIVLDPFCGSGTTGVACKLEGFDFVGMEQDTEYTKIAQARIENYVEEEEEELRIIEKIEGQLSLF